MRPPLLNLGGHEAFLDYQAAFNPMYAGRLIADPLGNTVSFAPNDCLHICYGGESRFWGAPTHWKQKRAERMRWIERAITAPNKIHPDKDYSKRRKYLLYLPSDNSTQENEFYSVIVEALDKTHFAFITAYDISQLTYRAYCNVPPCLYPSCIPCHAKKELETLAPSHKTPWQSLSALIFSLLRPYGKKRVRFPDPRVF